MNSSKSFASVLLAALALFPAQALAAGRGAPPPDSAPQPLVERPSPDRDGLTFGLALGGGELKLGGETLDADHTWGLSARVGLALSQTFLLQACFDATRAQSNGAGGDGAGALQLDFYGASATTYVTQRLYLGVGLGYARMVVDDERASSQTLKADSMGLLLAAGVELIQTSGFALSLEARGFGAVFDETKVLGGNVLLGLQWF